MMAEGATMNLHGKARKLNGRAAKDRRGDDDTGMREKYLHSQGAVHYEEGNFNRAIDFLRKAIALDDQPYTRSHLSLAYEEKGDTKRALTEIDRAIELNPCVAEYYYRRSVMRRRIGDDAGASEDYRKSIKIDQNFSRIEKIRLGNDALRVEFFGADPLDPLDREQIENQELRAMLHDIDNERHKTLEAVEETSCALPCPSYCCHFSGKPIRHGVYIEPYKLFMIRQFLREKGLPEGDFLERLSFKRDRHLVRLIPPNCVVKEKGEEFVYYPGRAGKPLGKKLLRDLPKGRDYQTLLWINETSKPCAFLSDRRCMIHDAGDEPGPRACKEFLCMTGFVFVVLKHLGMVADVEASARNMQELNNIAVEALLVLAEAIYGNDSIQGLKSATYGAVREALRADSPVGSKELARSLRQYRELRARYDAAFTAQKARAQIDIDILLGA
jgi:tetratricopeptide (TPR) repeat protein